MKQIFLFVLLLFSGIAARAQNMDSLINVLNTKKLTTDELLKVYQDICQHYFAAYDADKTMEYARKGLALSEKVKNKSKSSIFNEYVGYAYKDKKKLDSAFIYFEKTLKLAVDTKDLEQQVSAYLDIGAYYGDQEMWDLALEQFLKALPLSESLEDKAKYMSILGNIGSMHRMLDNPDKAIYYFERMKGMAEKTNSTPHKRKACYELGILYKDKTEYAKALEHLQSALEISRETNNKMYETICLQNLAQLYSHDEIKDFDKAVQYAKESLLLSKEIANPLYMTTSWTALSTIYSRQGNYTESIIAAHKAMECDSTNMKAKLSLYNNLTESYIGVGNKDSAIIFFHKYCELKDKYITKELQESVSDMEIKYETEKKEMRIASLEKERQLYVRLGIAGFLLMIALAVVLWQTKRNARKEKQLIATRSVMDGEMRERIRLAQDLHDRLSGNLSAAKIELAGNAESLHKVSCKLDTCIEEVRRVAHNLMPVSLQSGLKTALEDYTAKFPNVRFHFFGEDKHIDKGKEYIVYCCAGELVNNSLKHSGAKTINVQLLQGEAYVALTVEDDGCGFDEKSVTEGIGLKNIRDRLASCAGKIDVVSSPGKGTETTIEIKTK
jgi:signal transduction histidine kinase